MIRDATAPFMNLFLISAGKHKIAEEILTKYKQTNNESHLDVIAKSWGEKRACRLQAAILLAGGLALFNITAISLLLTIQRTTMLFLSGSLMLLTIFTTPFKHGTHTR